MNTLDTQIVETALLDIANGGSAYKANIAKLVLEEMSTKHYDINATDNVYQAMYKASLRNSIENDKLTAEATVNGVNYKPALYDISFYGFLQVVMDKCCWAVRRGSTSRASVKEREDELGGSNGLDWAQELGDDIGLDTSSLDVIESDVMEIYRKMFYTSTKMAAKLGMGRAESLALFAPTTLIEGEWVNEIRTNDWSEALSCMDHIAETLRKGEDVTTEDLNAPWEMEDRSPTPERLKELGDKFRANVAATQSA